MDFVHQSYEKHKTIAAIATPIGEGGISVIRISGENALDVANKVFSGNVFSYQTHTAHLGKILDKNQSPIDEVLLLVMLGHRSFTGEDTVEIHCHGGKLITQKVLDTIYQAGAQPALPGEFSFKAFMNGKIDLSQAEAIQELIAAKNTYAMKTAKNQLLGTLKTKIQSFQKDLTDITAVLEAWVDYPEEGLEFMSSEEMLLALSQTLKSMKHLNETFHDGKIVKSGISLCLVGLPNAGKSSLLNALLQKDRAIVTEIAGTTRDVLEEDFMLEGLHFRLIDTAGIRDTEEVIEKEGIKRSEEAYKHADLILFVIDRRKGFCEKAYELSQNLPLEKTVFVYNKNDCTDLKPITTTHNHQVSISAKQQTGLDTLKTLLLNVLWQNGAPPTQEIIITNSRHHEALNKAIHNIESVIEGLTQNVSPEFLCIDLKEALVNLGTISGTNITEDILSSIFSRFCVGK